METIRIGTRKSKLALWQAEFVAEKLNQAGFKTQLVLRETKGDKVLDVSISKIGSKGVFTEELEDQLARGEVDIAVHSAKDMQSRLPKGFELIAFTEREKVNDVIVSDQPISLVDPNLVLGTSSTRRVALLKHFYPHIKTVDVRGNLQTRLEKMRGGLCHGLVLAYAGVHRMGYHDLIRSEMSIDEFVPAVGQGSIAIETHESLSDHKKKAIKKAINHAETEQRLLAERAFLARLEGGCSIPVFALARIDHGQINMTGGIVSLDGTERVVNQVTGSDPQETGSRLAEDVLEKGGDKILKEIRKQI